MSVEEVLKELNEYGFHIVPIEADKFMCYGKENWFISDEDPFIIDGDGVLEIYEDYLRKINLAS